MGKMTKEEMLAVVNESISKMKNKDFNVYFFVLDTKNNPSGSLEYIYQTADTLINLGYKVTMLHQDKNDFVGVEGWLGEKYAKIPHAEISTSNININACDFLFIPEIFADVMSYTKTLPCKRVIITQNYQHMTEFMPVGITPEQLKIHDMITTSNKLAAKVQECFPDLSINVVPPVVKGVFRKIKNTDEKLIVNIVARNQSDVNRIIKPFYWKYPMYRFVTFRDLRGVSQEVFAEALREAALTICIDEETDFGYSMLEAMKSGCIVMSKVPKHLTDWMLEKDENGEEVITDACIWFDDVDELPRLVSSVVRTWIMDMIPESVYENQERLNDMFTYEKHEQAVKEVYVKQLFERRTKEFEEVKKQIENNGIKFKEE